MYKIIRYFQHKDMTTHKRTIKTGLTLEEAKKHCNDPSTHMKGPLDRYKGKYRNRFDGFTKE